MSRKRNRQDEDEGGKKWTFPIEMQFDIMSRVVRPETVLMRLADMMIYVPTFVNEIYRWSSEDTGEIINTLLLNRDPGAYQATQDVLQSYYKWLVSHRDDLTREIIINPKNRDFFEEERKQVEETIEETKELSRILQDMWLSYLRAVENERILEEMKRKYWLEDKSHEQLKFEGLEK